MQKRCHNNKSTNIDNQCAIKKSFAKTFQEQTTRVRKSKHPKIKTKFHRNYQVTHHK